MISFPNRPKEDEEPSHTDILGTFAGRGNRANALRQKVGGIQRLTPRQYRVAWGRVSKEEGNRK